MLGLNRGQTPRQAYVTIPRVLADLIAPDAPEPYLLVRPDLNDTSEIEIWLRTQSPEWKEAGHAYRKRAAHHFLFLRWRFTAQRLHRGGTP